VPSVRRPSVRLWQTELFIIVIVVAILILSVSLSQGLTSTLRQLGEKAQLSNASALASQLSPEFPLTVESRTRLRDHVSHFRLIYGADVWVYDIDGSIIDSEHSGGPSQAVLDEARIQGLADSPAYVSMDLKRGGYVVAGKAVYNPDGRRSATVVIANSVSQSLAVLDAVRSRLWMTFWIALIVAGLLGLGFSEFIGRRVRGMTKAAAAIAAGDFDQRLPTGLIPDEIFELAESYNRMAVRLGDTFTTLREREQEIAAVVESMAEGVIAFDSQGAVRIINPEAVALLGLPDDRDAIVGRHVSQLTDNRTIRDVVERSLAGTSASATTFRDDTAILIHGTPTTSAEDTTLGAVLLMSDITEQKRLEDAQRRFVADASHELRTPISALKGLLELLTGGAKDDPEVADDFLRTMTLEADRLGRLVTDLLTLAQLEGGGLKLERESVPVAELFEEVTSVMRPLAEGSGVTLLTEAADGDLEVWCDRDRIKQVLLGFVGNALTHTSEGGTIAVRATPSTATVTLEVSDNGAGIAPEALPHLFDRFFRADASRSATRGTGLGLSIAKEIVEAHHSSISVESEPNEGSSFRFDLPRAS
jgi:PAS domain S-box-containing protein